MNATPDTMRAAVLNSPGEVTLETRPVPEPGPGEVLVRVASVGTCGSDVHYYEHGSIGDFVMRSPLVLGHEPSGVVAATGAGVDPSRTGQRVALEPGVPCSRCEQCKLGRYNLCPEMRFFGTPPIDGAFREYVTLRADFAHPIPDAMSDDTAGLLEPLSVAVWACRKARVTAGSKVLITGAGPIGLVAAQVARAFGATEIMVTDVNRHRLDAAAAMGATATVDVSGADLADSGYVPDVLLECSGNPAATTAAIRRIGRAGRVVLTGMGGDELTLPMSRVQGFELEVTGTFRYASTWPTAISLVEHGAVTLDALVTHRFGLDEVERALTIAAEDSTTIKPVVRVETAA